MAGRRMSQSEDSEDSRSPSPCDCFEPSVSPPQPPTEAYLSTSLSTSSPLPPDHEPPILVLSLCNTLVLRKRGHRIFSRHPLVRPYLATFLSYACGLDPATGKPRFRVVALSTAHSANALSQLAAIDLIPVIKVPPHMSDRNYQELGVAAPYQPQVDGGDVLSLVFTRESAQLVKEDFVRNVQVQRNLGGIWTELGMGEEEGARRTVVVDCDGDAFVQHAYSLLPAFPLDVADEDIPSPAGIDLSYGPSTRLTVTSPRAVQLPKKHPVTQDQTLLYIISLLEQLRHQSNICNALREGFEYRLCEEAKLAIGEAGRSTGDHEAIDHLIHLAETTCRSSGIEVRERWRPSWREDLLKRERRGPYNGLPPQSSIDEQAVKAEQQRRVAKATKAEQADAARRARTRVAWAQKSTSPQGDPAVARASGRTAPNNDPSYTSWRTKYDDKYSVYEDEDDRGLVSKTGRPMAKGQAW
ncbi:hypothetical protein JCM11641_001204 [Rhodosporidiobolus odoratus]